MLCIGLKLGALVDDAAGVDDDDDSVGGDDVGEGGDDDDEAYEHDLVHDVTLIDWGSIVLMMPNSNITPT